MCGMWPLWLPVSRAAIIVAGKALLGGADRICGQGLDCNDVC